MFIYINFCILYRCL